MCSIDEEARWGPFVQDSRCGQLTFTLLFQESIFSLLPTACALVAVAFRVAYLLRQRGDKSIRTAHYFVKLAALLALAAFQLSIVVLIGVKSELRTRTSIADAAVRLCANLVFTYLSHLEHTRSFHPSNLLVGFFALSICADGIRMRTLWTLSNGTVLAGLFTASTLLRVVSLVLESWAKVSSLVAPYSSLSPESTAGLISLLTFWWLNPLLLKGSRSLVTINSLFAIDNRFNSKSLSDGISKNLGPDRSQSLFWVSLKQHKQYLILGAFFRLLLMACTFSQPFLVGEVTKFGNVQESPGKPVGAWLVVAYGFVYVGMAIATAGHGHQTNKLIIGVRGSLTMALYGSALDMTESDAQNSESAELTLVSSDMEKIAFGLQTIHHLWATVVEIGLSIWLLQRQMHLATVGPVLFAIVCVASGAALGASAGKDQAAWLRAIQTRVHATSAVLSSLRYIQMTALDDVVKASISKLREIEVAVSKKYRGSLVWIVTITHLTSVVCPLLGFTIFTLSSTANQGVILTASRAFSSFIIFMLLGQAVGNFVPAALGFMVVLSCFGRFTQFMKGPHPADVSPDASVQTLPAYKSVGTQALQGLQGSSATMIRLEDLPVSPATTPITDEVDSKRMCAAAQNIEVGWRGSRAAFSELSFTIGKGQFVLVTGEPNSGKSTLLKTLLGEIPIRSGTLISNIGRAAFCSQKPWILNDTFVNNVIGASAYDEAWFDTVVNGCGLRKDLECLPYGGKTVVGTEGLRLSGGQRIRLALARAVYSREEILVLDNVFHGSDPNTATHILNALFGSRGILRSRGATVVYASVNDAFRAFADQVIDLDDVHSSNSKPEDAVSRASKSEESEKEGAASYSSSSNQPPVQGGPHPSQEENSEAPRAPADSTIYWYYMKTLGLWRTLIFAIWCSILVFGLTFPQIWIAWWAAANEKHDFSRTGFYVGIYFLLAGVAISTLILGARQLLLVMIPRSAIMLHSTLLKKAFNATLTFITTEGAGQIINRFSQDLSIIDTDVPIGFYQTFFAALSGIAQAVFMCLGYRYNAVALPFCLIILYGIQKFYLRTARQLRILDLESKASLLAHISTTILGRVTIRSFGWDEQYTSGAAALLDRSLKAHYLLLCVQQWLRLVLGLMVAVLALALASLSVYLSSSSGAAFLGVALTGLVNFSSSMSALIGSWTYLETAIQAVVRIKTFSAGHEKGEVDVATVDAPADWPHAGAIAFHNVSVVYEKDARAVLQELTFTINGGERIGICGRTGGGKSSIINSLLRCVEISSGEIVIDGVNISTISPRLLRSNVLSMSQENFVLPGTVRFNVDPHGSLTDEELVSYLEEVKLWDHVRENGGLETDARDCILSASHAQLLCLARILSRRSSIVVMDEATSNLNSDTASLIRNVCREKYAGSTLIIISHTLEELLDCDRVMVVDAGRIVEFDNPATLVQQEGSVFRHLFRSSIT